MCMILLGMKNAEKIYKDKLHYAKSAKEALNNANVCFIFTEWNEIKNLTPQTFTKYMKNPLVYDGRNIFDVNEMKKNGVEYYSIGRSVMK